MATQQSLFGGKTSAKKARKTRAKTTADTRIKVSGYTRKRGKLPGRTAKGRFKKG